MNFKRIEIVFIFVFLFLDIFLLINFRQTVGVKSASEKETTVADTISAMRKDNITVPKLSSKREQKGYLLSHSHTGSSANYGSVNEEKNVKLKQKRITLSEPIIVSSRDAVKVLKDYVKSGKILNSQDYVYSEDLSSSKHVVFVQKFKNSLFYDLSGQISFDIKNKMVSDYQISHIESLSESKDTETILSEQEAVAKLYTLNDIPNNTKIIWYQLAYSWMLDANNVSVYVPTWFVAIENKRTKSVTIEKINAFTGAPWKAEF